MLQCDTYTRQLWVQGVESRLGRFCQLNFIVELVVTGVDSGPGVIQMLTNELSNKLGINIKNFSMEGKEGFYEGKSALWF